MTLAKCPWYIAGPLIGLLIVGRRATLNRPLGALGGWVEFTDRVTNGRRLGPPAFIAVGTVLGGLLFAMVTGSFHPALHYGAGTALGAADTPAQFALLSVAGVLIGFGARTAGGCTSGHGLCGTSTGSPASLVATITFFGTAVVMAQVFARLLGGV